MILDGIASSEMPDAELLDELLVRLPTILGTEAADQLRRSFAVQCLRAVEIGLLADVEILDVALNPGLYLGSELEIIRRRIDDRCGDAASDALAAHLRALIMSGVPQQSGKVNTDPLVSRVFETCRTVSDELRCRDCGYWFTESDLGVERRDLADRAGLRFAPEQLSRRLRDEWKPVTGDRTSLSMDHIVPEACLGATTVENLAVLCGLCNNRKQIYRWSTEVNGRDVAAALLNRLGRASSWQLEAALYSTVASSRKCSTCSETIARVELTAASPEGTVRESHVTLPWTLRAVCYSCFDPGGSPD